MRTISIGSTGYLCCSGKAIFQKRCIHLDTITAIGYTTIVKQPFPQPIGETMAHSWRIEHKYTGKGFSFIGTFIQACERATAEAFDGPESHQIYCVWSQPDGMKRAECNLRGVTWKDNSWPNCCNSLPCQCGEHFSYQPTTEEDISAYAYFKRGY